MAEMIAAGNELRNARRAVGARLATQDRQMARARTWPVVELEVGMAAYADLLRRGKNTSQS